MCVCVCVFVCGALVLVCVSERLYLCAIWDSAYSGTYFFSKLAIVRMCKNVRFKNLNHSLLLSRSHTLRSVCSSLVYLATPYSVYLCAFACVRFCLHVYILCYAMLCYMWWLCAIPTIYIECMWCVRDGCLCVRE